MAGRRPRRTWRRACAARATAAFWRWRAPPPLAAAGWRGGQARRHGGAAERRRHHQLGRGAAGPAGGAGGEPLARPAPRRPRPHRAGRSRWAPFTWLRVGGPADVLFLPAGRGRPGPVPAPRWIPRFRSRRSGVGSNTLVRDGGVEGVVVRLGRAFADHRGARRQPRLRRRRGARRARWPRRRPRRGSPGWNSSAACPGPIGGACVMNAGCYGSETKDVLVEAYALDPLGRAVDAVQRRDGLQLSPRGGRGRALADLHRRPVRGNARRSGRGHRAHGRDHRPARGQPADPREDRRLDLQEPARPLGLEAGRRGGLARPARSAGRCSRPCTPTS